jgi:hypothetical protein
MGELTITERFDSRAGVAGTDPSVNLLYTVRGTEDDRLVRSLIEDIAPEDYDLGDDGVVRRQDFHIEPSGGGLWEVRVPYGREDRAEVGESQFNFETGGGTQHITQALQTSGKFASPGKTPPDFKGAIGVTKDSVEGVDIVVPVYTFAETHYLSAEVVDYEYRGKVFALTGRTNAQPFKGLDPGECLFLGAAGSQRGNGPWEITYKFAGSPNVEDVQIGEIVGVSKGGWEYLWVLYEDAEDGDAKRLVKRPAAVYVEQVYKAGDFGELLIGT